MSKKEKTADEQIEEIYRKNYPLKFVDDSIIGDDGTRQIRILNDVDDVPINRKQPYRDLVYWIDGKRWPAHDLERYLALFNETPRMQVWAINVVPRWMTNLRQVSKLAKLYVHWAGLITRPADGYPVSIRIVASLREQPPKQGDDFDYEFDFRVAFFSRPNVFINSVAINGAQGESVMHAHQLLVALAGRAVQRKFWVSQTQGTQVESGTRGDESADELKSSPVARKRRLIIQPADPEDPVERDRAIARIITAHYDTQPRPGESEFTDEDDDDQYQTPEERGMVSLDAELLQEEAKGDGKALKAIQEADEEEEKGSEESGTASLSDDNSRRTKKPQKPKKPRRKARQWSPGRVRSQIAKYAPLALQDYEPSASVPASAVRAPVPPDESLQPPRFRSRTAPTRFMEIILDHEANEIHDPPRPPAAPPQGPAGRGGGKPWPGLRRN